MKTYGVGIPMVAVILGMMLGASCSQGPRQGWRGRGGDPLRAAWRIAGAITNDADDRADCRMSVALARIGRGEVEDAARDAEAVGGWRRGVVLAEVAGKMAEEGRTNAAQEHAAAAAAAALDIQDWQRDRIRARLARAYALLGGLEMAESVRTFYGTNRDYRGETTAYYALALARGGRTEEALATLDALADTDFFDVTVWRAKGYALLSADRRAGVGLTNVLDRAWEASQRIAGPRRWEMQMELAGETGVGSVKAREWIGQVESNVMGAAMSAHLEAPLLVRLCVHWAKIRDAGRLERCERVALEAIRQVQNIERPALFARLGEAYAVLGDTQKALTYYEHAEELATGLVNLRPRSIACVELCLSLDRAGLDDRRAGGILSRLLHSCGVGYE